MFRKARSIISSDADRKEVLYCKSAPILKCLARFPDLSVNENAWFFQEQTFLHPLTNHAKHFVDFELYAKVQISTAIYHFKSKLFFAWKSIFQGIHPH